MLKLSSASPNTLPPASLTASPRIRRILFTSSVENRLRSIYLYIPHDSLYDSSTDSLTDSTADSTHYCVYNYSSRATLEIIIFTSILTMLWIPLAVLLHVRKSHTLERGAARGFAPLHSEMVGLWVVWIFWLVGDAVATVSNHF